MSVVVGLDLGTTTLTTLAVDVADGAVLARVTVPNRAEITRPADRALGLSEWDMDGMVEGMCAVVRTAAAQLGPRLDDVAAVGLTGQQHGCVIVDAERRPLTPFIGWQDRRADRPLPGGTALSRALERLGPEAPQRTGCRLASGYLAVTLCCLNQDGALPENGRACFAVDYLGAALADRPAVTDPTLAASSGVFNLRTGDWDTDCLERLGLPRPLFPDVLPSGSLLGPLTPAAAARTGLPAGAPVFGGIGDNQASFLGSVAEPDRTVLVNVGTGGQVAVRCERPLYEPPLEARPYSDGGFLLVCAGLSGGRAYAVLESFFRQAGRDVYGLTETAPLFEALNRLAAMASIEDGPVCEPFFFGTRHEPQRRAAWSGLTAANFTPGGLARSLLWGMATAFRSGYDAMRPHLTAARTRLVGAGNGVRENALLTELLSKAFGLPVEVPAHREEATFGAALLAARRAGLLPNAETAGHLIRYEPRRSAASC
jgi:sugar (pentulose or hexulose) kinase